MNGFLSFVYANASESFEMIVEFTNCKSMLVALSSDMVNETTCIGYHLGQVYIFSIQLEDADAISLKIVKKFDAHSRPITGIILNEDIGRSSAT